MFLFCLLLLLLLLRHFRVTEIYSTISKYKSRSICPCMGACLYTISFLVFVSGPSLVPVNLRQAKQSLGADPKPN